PGTYEEYEEWQSKRDKGPVNTSEIKKEKVKKEEPKVVSDDVNRQLKKLNTQLKKLEEEITAQKKEIEKFEAEIAREEVYSDANKLAEANSNYTQSKEVFIKLQNEWEKLAEEILILED